METKSWHEEREKVLLFLAELAKAGRSLAQCTDKALEREFAYRITWLAADLADAARAYERQLRTKHKEEADNADNQD